MNGKEIEQIIRGSKEEFDWEPLHGWLHNTEMPFQKPIILDTETTIWGYCTIHPQAKIGRNVVIGAFTNICGPVEIGDETRMQGFNFIPDGVTIEKRVFVGPGVIFTNMKYPTARFGKAARQRVFDKILVKERASIGAGAIICPNVTIGRYAMVAAGSVVSKDFMDGWLVKGNPARHIREFVDFKQEEARAKEWHMDH